MQKKDDMKIFRQTIVAHAQNTNITSVEVLKDEFRGIFHADAEIMYESYLGNQIRTALASMKDTDGNRLMLSATDENGKKIFVNIENCEDEKLLSQIKKRLERRRKGLNKSIRKTSKRLKQIEGQMEMELSESK